MRYVMCTNRACTHRNSRAGGRRKCEACGAPLPKRRVPKHAKVLRDMPYREWVALNEAIHGAGEDCGVCGKASSPERHHDRDHDHDTGQPRGLACGGDFGCNRMMPRGLTAARARELAHLLESDLTYVEADAVSPYLPRDLTWQRATEIAAYLERVEAFYRVQP